jgi:hypothetical protein
MRFNGFVSFLLICGLALNGTVAVAAQSFEKVELLVVNGKDIDERDANFVLSDDTLVIETTGREKIVKSFKYSDIRSAEYSYSKNPRWKTGLGLGAASLVFPPLLLVALPLGFSKHRRHWLTIRTGSDYAVLKINKRYRKLLLPAFETRSGVRVVGTGEEK